MEIFLAEKFLRSGKATKISHMKYFFSWLQHINWHLFHALLCTPTPLQSPPPILLYICHGSFKYNNSLQKNLDFHGSYSLCTFFPTLHLMHSRPSSCMKADYTIIIMYKCYVVKFSFQNFCRTSTRTKNFNTKNC